MTISVFQIYVFCQLTVSGYPYIPSLNARAPLNDLWVNGAFLARRIWGDCEKSPVEFTRRARCVLLLLEISAHITHNTCCNRSTQCSYMYSSCHLLSSIFLVSWSVSWLDCISSFYLNKNGSLGPTFSMVLRAVQSGKNSSLGPAFSTVVGPDLVPIYGRTYETGGWQSKVESKMYILCCTQHGSL